MRRGASGRLSRRASPTAAHRSHPGALVVARTKGPRRTPHPPRATPPRADAGGSRGGGRRVGRDRRARAGRLRGPADELGRAHRERPSRSDDPRGPHRGRRRLRPQRSARGTSTRDHLDRALATLPRQEVAVLRARVRTRHRRAVDAARRRRATRHAAARGRRVGVVCPPAAPAPVTVARSAGRAEVAYAPASWRRASGADCPSGTSA